MGKPRLLAVSLDDASLSRFHMRAVLVSGVGFFTDAYDLFIIGITATLVQQQWNVDTAGLAMLSSVTLAASFLGALIFGRTADLLGRTRVYWLVAVILIVGALASALAPSYWVLVLARFVLGIGIGGDYPVSAVLMSEYANREDRGKLVGMVFAAQALGLIVGPVVALSLLGSGVSHALAWRVMLGLGAIPAVAVVYLRRAMPESPRYAEQVQGAGKKAAVQLARFTNGAIGPDAASYPWKHRMDLRLFWSFLKYRYVLLGTAGTWFLFDYAYYGNTISSPRILKMVSPHASLMTVTALQLLIFVVAALPGYLLAIAWMDRIGHRRLQYIGFAAMGVCFALAGIIPGASTALAPFLILFGISYFFAEFGPNTTLFVLPAELFPVSVRATGHGISSGVAKLGAFIGVFLFGFLQTSLGLRGTLILSAVIAAGGALLTLLLEEPARRSLEEVAADDDVVDAFEPEITGTDTSSVASLGPVPLRLRFMACRISELVLGCRDPERLARFWCEVLDFVVLDREGEDMIEIGPREGFGGPQPTIILSRRDEPEPGKSRLHIDVNATDRDQDAELERLLKLGARPADIGQTGQEPWHVLSDPEGNEFCLLQARLGPL